MTDTKHTPTPWKSANSFIISGDDIVASCITSTVDSEQGRANAAHIVKCVNMHDELASYLMICLDIFESEGTKERVCSDIREALKKAGAL